MMKRCGIKKKDDAEEGHEGPMLDSEKRNPPDAFVRSHTCTVNSMKDEELPSEVFVGEEEVEFIAFDSIRPFEILSTCVIFTPLYPTHDGSDRIL